MGLTLLLFPILRQSDGSKFYGSFPSITIFTTAVEDELLLATAAFSLGVVLFIYVLNKEESSKIQIIS